MVCSGKDETSIKLFSANLSHKADGTRAVLCQWQSSNKKTLPWALRMSSGIAIDTALKKEWMVEKMLKMKKVDL